MSTNSSTLDETYWPAFPATNDTTNVAAYKTPFDAAIVSTFPETKCATNLSTVELTDDAALIASFVAAYDNSDCTTLHSTFISAEFTTDIFAV